MRQAFIPGSFRPPLPSGDGGEKALSHLCLDGTSSSNSHRFKALRCPVILASAFDSKHSELIENQLPKDHSCAFLYLQELGSIWNFTYRAGVLTFTLRNRPICPSGIYHRKCLLDTGHPQYDAALLLNIAIDLWPGPQIGSNAMSFANSSKPYQLLTTILPASRAKKGLAIPPTFLFKGTESELRTLLATEGSLIVKSCSSTRSQVVDETTFLDWNSLSTNSLPILFQKRFKGEDVRIHLLEPRAWAVKVMANSRVDYRFEGSGARFHRLTPNSALLALLRSMAQSENLRLSGIDLMCNQDETICLEINPSPAWCAFDLHHSKSIARAILKTLEGTRAR